MRFNVIGYVTSGIGLGIMACDVIRALSDLGHEVAAFDLPCGLQREGRELRSKAYARAASQMFRDGVDVVILPVFQFDEFNQVRFGPRRVARPFDGVRWSTEHARADTLANFAGRRVALLRTLRDVDTAADLGAQCKVAPLPQA